MKKTTTWLSLTFVCVCIASACAQVGQWVNYTISAAELERLTLSELEKHRFEMNVMGATARLNIDELGLTLDEDGDGLMHMRTQSTLSARVLGVEYPVSIRLNIAGAPRYSAADHAIYIAGLTLQDSSIETGFGQLRVNGLSQELYALVHDWLDNNPVYRFNPEDSRYRLLQQLGLDISVEPGQIRVQGAERAPN